MIFILCCWCCVLQVNGNKQEHLHGGLTGLTGGTAYKDQYFLYALCSNHYVRIKLGGKRHIDARGTNSSRAGQYRHGGQQ
jgi:hypothetical protein